MTGAMYAAIGGLKTHMTNLNVIGNNIANVNTAGYKDQRMTFQEAIYTTSKPGSNGTLILGGNNPSQIGYGAQVGSIDLNMSPGTFNPTGRDLDCMIEGDGFFLVGDKNYNFRSGEDFTIPMLTRVGNFWQDAEGYICDRSGNVVYGFATVLNPFYLDHEPTAADQATVDAAKAMGVNTTDQYIVSSDLVPLRLPLAAQQPTVANGGIDPNDPDNPRWAVGDPVYSLLGVANPDNNNARTNYSLVDEEGKLKEGLAIGENGGITGLPVGTGTVSGREAGAANSITADGLYTGPIPNEYNECISIEGLRITDTGAIVGTCDNGQNVVVGYAAIAKVMAPDGVTHIGGPYYKCMEGAGDIKVGAVGGIMEGRYLNNQIVLDADGDNPVVPNIKDSLSPCAGTEIQGGGLEASTTDVATEFSNMILTQRGYQANTRIVTVTDSMLEELVNMKR